MKYLLLIPLLLFSLISVAPAYAQTDSIVPTIYCVGGSGVPPCAPFPSTAPSVAQNSPSISPSSPVPSTSIAPSTAVNPCAANTSVNNDHKKNKKSGFGQFFQKIFDLLKQLLGGKPAPTTPAPSAAPSTSPSTAPSDAPSTAPSTNPCPSTAPSAVPSTATSQTPSTSSAPSSAPSVSPCATGTTSVFSNHSKHRPKWRRGRGGKKREGFFEKLFKWLLQLIEQLIGGGSGGGTPTPTPTPSPCPGASTAPAPSASPSTAPVQPSTAVSAAPGTSVAPSTAVVPSTAPSAAPVVPTTPPSGGGNTVSPPAANGSNYSGYYYNHAAATNDTVHATWTASGFDCTNGGNVSPWVGMGDTPNQETNLAQLGNDMDCSSGSPVYPIWTEALPAGSIYDSTHIIHPGDTITASVTYLGQGAFSTILTDPNQGWSVSMPMSYSISYAPVGGEVIFEEVGGLGVPTFSPFTFTNAQFSLGSTTAFQPLSAATALSRLDMLHAVTSALAGSTFTMTFK